MFWNEQHRTRHATLMGRFRFDFMLWSLSGGPPHYDDYVSEGEALVPREVSALAGLGYFQKRMFPLKGQNLSEVMREIENIPSKDGLWRIFPNKDDDSVTVYACKEDMRLIEAIFADRNLR